MLFQCSAACNMFSVHTVCSQFLLASPDSWWMEQPYREFPHWY